MCGIAGIIGDGATRFRENVQAMLDAMPHRGPDGEGVWSSSSDQCVLGHRRLSILDLSERAAQPMASADGRFAISYNGECYNYRELRDQLRKAGCAFRSSGDTETVLQVLATQGVSALSRLNGMFAIAFWDERNRRLTLARDRFGQKPLYWTRIKQSRVIVFASEVRALLASGLVERRVCRQGLAGYLSHGSCPGPETILQDVQLLPPASMLSIDGYTRLQIEPYWRPSKARLPADDASLRDALVKAVERHLLSDVDVGLFLSGGVDSSVLVGAARRCQTSPVTTLTVTFPDQPQQCEGRHARHIADQHGSKHIEVPITQQDSLELVQSAVHATDQPTIDGVNTYLVSHAARSAGLSVAISGLGADELFGGYSTFVDVPRMLSASGWCRGASLFPNWASRRGSFRSRKIAKLIDFFDSPQTVFSAYITRRRLLTSRQVQLIAPGLTQPAWLSGLCNQRQADLERITKELPVADAVGLLELDVYMSQTLLRDTDIMGMAHSLEVRVPFLDNEFSEMALAQPTESRLPKQVRKWRLIDACGQWLPEQNWRRRKQGFTLPWDHWLSGRLCDPIGSQLQWLSHHTDLFDANTLSILWNRYLRHPAKVGWSRIWMLYVLACYLQRHQLTV